jgi:hypothetical protein
LPSACGSNSSSDTMETHPAFPNTRMMVNSWVSRNLRQLHLVIPKRHADRKRSKCRRIRHSSAHGLCRALSAVHNSIRFEFERITRISR